MEDERAGKEEQPAKKILVIENSTTTGVKAAKNLNLPKEVYRIGNIDYAFTIDGLPESYQCSCHLLLRSHF